MSLTVPDIPQALQQKLAYLTPNSQAIVGNINAISIKGFQNINSIVTFYNYVIQSFNGLPGYKVSGSGNDLHLEKISLECGPALNLEEKHVTHILEKTHIWDYKRPVDLGCMLGQIPATGLFYRILDNAVFTGVDLDYEFILAAEAAKRRLAAVDPLFSFLNFLWGNALTLDFSKHDYFIVNAPALLSSEALKKFASEAAPKSLFVQINETLEDFSGEPAKNKNIAHVTKKYKVEPFVRVFSHK